MKQTINLESTRTWNQTSERQLGLDQTLHFADIKICSQSFLSVINQWHIWLKLAIRLRHANKHLDVEVLAYQSTKELYVKLCSCLSLSRFSHKSRFGRILDNICTFIVSHPKKPKSESRIWTVRDPLLQSFELTPTSQKWMWLFPSPTWNMHCIALVITKSQRGDAGHNIASTF